MENNMLTVVVPVYNNDKYLKQCVNSILNQTYSQLEIILVDDGSTDNSAAICDYYQTIDATVKGNATITSATKARMSKTSDGERCIIEFEKQGTSTIKATEFSCEAGRDRGTDYSGVLKK